MEMITKFYISKLENNRDFHNEKMIKTFKSKMRLRYRITLSMIEKYKDDFWFMVETNNPCMIVVIPRVKFIELVGYKMIIELKEGYAQIILESK